jgi:DNA-binding PadR family transcriptional regulator
MECSVPEISQNHRPLTETTFYILLCIAEDRKHGYAILKDVRALSQNRVVLSTGTLYGALKRLLDQGLIERVEEEKPKDVGRPRKFYVLTQVGSKVLEAEMARLCALVKTAQQLLPQFGN